MSAVDPEEQLLFTLNTGIPVRPRPGGGRKEGRKVEREGGKKGKWGRARESEIKRVEGRVGRRVGEKEEEREGTERRKKEGSGRKEGEVTSLKL